MNKYPVILDLETKHTFRDFSEPEKLGLTVVAVYDFAKDQSKVFSEKEVNRLFPILENASYLIGFNIKSFDLPVLQPYYPGKIEHFLVFDILDDIKNKLGRRLALNDVAFATLGKKKTGHGLEAIELYKEGRIDELKSYCLNDVLLTKELFEFGVEKGEIYYLTENGKSVIKVDWEKYKEDSGSSDSHLTLPF